MPTNVNECGVYDLLCNSFGKYKPHELERTTFDRRKVPANMETRGKTLRHKGQIGYHKKITNKEDEDSNVDIQLTKERLQFSNGFEILATSCGQF